MSLFKCKMCGGSLDVPAGASVIECEYCGTQQTLPRLDDEKRANLYDRANHFRRGNEFDKAMGIYENILNDDNTDAEAYWSIVLCRYGIEYVVDPATRRRIPTVNRAQFASIFADEDYKSAIANADAEQRSVYEREAREIDEIQRGILEISRREEPFDVFICYKETDAGGRRTLDSVLAQELYYGLKNEGFKVFFSRITLEDKLGSAYEPYIFAALNSAKVMVVLGTKPEHFDAVWVKNEWSRYLALIKQGQEKTLIPAYKNMDSYDLPDEFSHLQAQDMSRLGFMQDLIRGVKKIVGEDKRSSAGGDEKGEGRDVYLMLRRVNLFLEDGDWESANEYCERVLDRDPENAQAYLGKLLAELRLKREVDLGACATPLDDNGNYQKAIRFANAELRERLIAFAQGIKSNHIAAKYGDIVRAMGEAKTEEEYKTVAARFEKMGEYENAKELYEECLQKAEDARRDAIYESARLAIEKDTIEKLREAIARLREISGWRDSGELIFSCERRIAEINEFNARRLAKARQEAAVRVKQEKKNTAITMIIICSISGLIVGGIILGIVLGIIGILDMKHRSYALEYIDVAVTDKVSSTENGYYTSELYFTITNDCLKGVERIDGEMVFYNGDREIGRYGVYFQSDIDSTKTKEMTVEFSGSGNEYRALCETPFSRMRIEYNITSVRFDNYVTKSYDEGYRVIKAASESSQNSGEAALTSPSIRHSLFFSK